MEKEQRSYIIEGFPRTEVQAIALQKMGILPDNFILLQQSDQFSCERIIENLSSEDSVVKCKDIESVEELAINAVVENNIHMEGVKAVCKGFITELDGTKSVQ